MKREISIQGVMRRVAPLAARVRGGVAFLAGMLTVSLADVGVIPRGALAVAIEKDGVSVVYASRFLSSFTLQRIETVPFIGDGYPGPEQVVSAVETVRVGLAERRIDARMIIPKAWAVVRTVELPSAAGENLNRILGYELDRLSPFSSEDAYYDYHVVKQDQETICILLSVAKKEAIDPYLKALSEKGVEIRGVGIGLLEVAALCSYPKNNGPTLFLKIDDDGMEGCAVVNGLVTAIFPNVAARRNGRQAERGFDSDGVRRILERTTSNGTSPEIVLWSTEEIESRVKREVKAPARRLSHGSINARFPEGLKEPVPYNAVGGALAPLRKEAKTPDLLTGGRHAKQKRPVLLTCLLALSIALVAALYLLMPLYFEGKKLAEMDRQIAMRKDETRKAELLRTANEKLRTEVGAIRDFKRNRGLTLSTMKEINSVLPKTAWLSRLKVSDASVEMEGYAKSAAEVLSRVQASKTFSKAEFSSPPVKDPRMNGERFSVKIAMEGAPKDVPMKGKDEKKQR